MALINCPECKTEVSDTAFDCPKCAATLKKPTRTFFGKLIKLIFLTKRQKQFISHDEI